MVIVVSVSMVKPKCRVDEIHLRFYDVEEMDGYLDGLKDDLVQEVVSYVSSLYCLPSGRMECMLEIASIVEGCFD